MANTVVSLALVVSSMLCVGCCEPYESAECFPLPEQDIYALTVTVTTGEEISFADVDFCLRLHSDDEARCEGLRRGPYSMFLPRSTDSFTFVNIVADLSDLESMFFINDSRRSGDEVWEVVGLFIEAHLEDGTTEVLYREPLITCGGLLDPGDTYELMRCDW